MKINGKNLVFLLLVVFILFFQTSCRNKEKEEQAWEKYKNFSQLSKKYESNPEKFNSDLEAISKEMDDILPDIKDPEKRGEVLSLKAYSVGILGRETGVEELFDEATKMSPQNYLVYLRYGKYSYLQDKKTKALNFLENSLNYMPEHLIEPRIEALFLQGNILFDIEKYHRSEEKYINCVELAENYGIRDNQFYEQARKKLERIRQD